jgi:hypothetical protein
VIGLVPHLITGGVVILQYPNDTILLIQDDMKQIIHLKWILYMFEVIYGLKINFLKSEVMLFLHMMIRKSYMMTYLAAMLGIGKSII